MLGFLRRHAQTFALVLGFLFGTVGAVWSFLYVERLGDDVKHAEDIKADLTQQVQNLGSLAQEYFLANQQGDLVFLLAQQGDARKELAGLIYKGNILDRATPVHQMIGALAIAHQLDYRQTYDKYLALNNEARANLTFANFQKLKDEERQIITQGEARVPLLQKAIFEADKAINTTQALQTKNRVIGISAAILGNFLLLVANLVARPEKS
jgi:hypothetical protein